MANKLYEEEDIRAIAGKIRQFSFNKAATYSVSEMAQGVESACNNQYESGRDAGIEAGEEYVKTEEARTEADVVAIIDVDSDFAVINVSGGYYGNNVAKSVDLTPVCDARFDAGYDAGHTEGYNEGYEEGYAQGISEGGGSSSDPTTVWELNDSPDYASLPNSSNRINVNFISNEEEFIAIYGATTGVRQGITYVKSSGSTVVAYNSMLGWTNANYKTTTFPDPITDETLSTWLPENGRLISGGSGGGGGSSEDLEALGALCEWSIMTNSESIPTIYIYNYHPTYYMHCCLMTGIGDIPFYSTEEEDIYPEGGNLVIEPGECLCVTYDNAFSVLDGIEVLDVRWTKDGTI